MFRELWRCPAPIHKAKVLRKDIALSRLLVPALHLVGVLSPV